MSYLYLTDQGTKLSFEENQIVAVKLSGETKRVPIELVEGVSLFGNISMTTPFIQEMLKREIPVTFLSSTGSFFGKLESTKQTNIVKQAYQFRVLYDKSFCLELSKKIVNAKAGNQIIIARRYNKNKNVDAVDTHIQKMMDFKNRIYETETIQGLMGIEGMIARHYFGALGKLVPRDFYFGGRSKMPPKDPFNSLLSMGYTLLMYEIYNILISSGLNPYLGFFHKVRNQHPALASDLMEEWRAVLIDSLSLNLVMRSSISYQDFDVTNKSSGVYIGKDAIKIFISKYEEKIRTPNEYYKNRNEDGKNESDTTQEMDYRKTIIRQVSSYYNAVKEKDLDLYSPLIIR